MRLNSAGPVAALLASALVSGCAGTLGLVHHRTPPPPVQPAVVAAKALTAHLDLVERFMQSTPAEQAKILATVKQDYDRAPTEPSQELDYALVLAVPDHAGSDPNLARQLLSGILDPNSSLKPPERALARLLLGNVDRQLDLAATNHRIKTQFALSERVLTKQAKRRLEAEMDENHRLRRDLARARAKLKAVANIERSLNQRKGTPKGHTP